jgi:hypothetical protein
MNLGSMSEQERMVWAARQLLLSRAKGDFARFIPAVLRDGRDAPVHPTLLNLTWWAHARWAWERDLHAGIYAVHPTAGFVTGLAAYLAGHGHRVQVVTASPALAAHRLRAIRAILESPTFTRVFPGFDELKWGPHSAAVEAESSAPPKVAVDCRPVASRAGSPGYDRLIFDSAVEPNAGTQAHQEAIQRQVEATWIGGLEPGGHALWLSPRVAGGPGPALRDRPDFAWLDQRPTTDGQGWEQEVYGAPPEYPGELEALLLAMVTG